MHLDDEEILNLLEIPYESEDECSKILGFECEDTDEEEDCLNKIAQAY